MNRNVVASEARQLPPTPASAILQSVLHRRGLEFLLVFPRQSGKNEAVAQLLVCLLNLYHRAGDLRLGTACSEVIPGTEPLDHRDFCSHTAPGASTGTAATAPTPTAPSMTRSETQSASVA